MAEAARTAAVSTGYKQEVEETDIDFRMEVDQRREGLGLQGGVNTATSFKKIKIITHKHGLCGAMFWIAFLHLSPW